MHGREEWVLVWLGSQHKGIDLSTLIFIIKTVYHTSLDVWMLINFSYMITMTIITHTITS